MKHLFLLSAFAAMTRHPNIRMEAHNGGGSGGGSKPSPVDEIKGLKQTNSEQLTRIGSLQTELNTARDRNAEQLTQIGSLQTELKTAQDKTAEQLTQIGSLQTELKASQDQVGTLTGEVKSAKEGQDKAENDLKTADDRAESKLRETVAKHGGVLPPKDHKAGNESDEKEPDANETPHQRLASFFKVQG